MARKAYLTTETGKLMQGAGKEWCILMDEVFRQEKIVAIVNNLFLETNRATCYLQDIFVLPN